MKIGKQINMDHVNFKKWQVVRSNLEIKADKLDIEKLETTLVDLSKLSNLVKMKLLKRLNIIN